MIAASTKSVRLGKFNPHLGPHAFVGLKKMKFNTFGIIGDIGPRSRTDFQHLALGAGEHFRTPIGEAGFFGA